MTFTDTAQAALTFARSHDWGGHADLRMIDGVETLVGMVERYNVGDDVLVVLPATRTALREWFY